MSLNTELRQKDVQFDIEDKYCEIPGERIKMKVLTSFFDLQSTFCYALLVRILLYNVATSHKYCAMKAILKSFSENILSENRTFSNLFR